MQRKRRKKREGLDVFCSERKLHREYLEKTWGIKEVVFKGRPALQYPTRTGIDRIKYLDNNNDRYFWTKQGGKAHWYGLDTALKNKGQLYLVNGEPSVWAAQQVGIAAICNCSGEGTPPTNGLVKELCDSGIKNIRVVYDHDDTGRLGAVKTVEALKGGGIEAVALCLAGEVGAGGDVDDLHRKYGEKLEIILKKLPELKNEDTDLSESLAVLENIDKNYKLEEAVSALQGVADLLVGADPATIEVTREKAIQILKSKKFQAPTQVVKNVFPKPTVEGKETNAQGSDMVWDEPILWPEEVNGNELLDDIVKALCRYIELQECCPEAIALWILHAHAHDAAYISPILDSLV